MFQMKDLQRRLWVNRTVLVIDRDDHVDFGEWLHSPRPVVHPALPDDPGGADRRRHHRRLGNSSTSWCRSRRPDPPHQLAIPKHWLSWPAACSLSCAPALLRLAVRSAGPARPRAGARPYRQSRQSAGAVQSLRAPAQSHSRPSADARPQVVLYHSGPPDTAYQINQWLHVLEALPFRCAILLRNKPVFGIRQGYRPSTSISLRGARQLETLLSSGPRTLLYPNNREKNHNSLRYFEADARLHQPRRVRQGGQPEQDADGLRLSLRWRTARREQAVCRRAFHFDRANACMSADLPAELTLATTDSDAPRE